MVTDDERRRVAEKLRASIPGDGVMRRGDKGWSLLYRTIFGHYMSNQSAGRTYSEVAGRLADLIDPVPACDRVALLKLADELDAQQANKGIRQIGPYMQPGEAARRIREALGAR